MKIKVFRFDWDQAQKRRRWIAVSFPEPRYKSLWDAHTVTVKIGDRWVSGSVGRTPFEALSQEKARASD